MYILDDDEYMPLLAMTYAVTAGDSIVVNNIFDKFLGLMPTDKVKDIFIAHRFCTTMTIEEYQKYQYFYGLCVVFNYTKDKTLESQIEKLFRSVFPAIYSVVRKKNSFNIMDYTFLYLDADGLTIMDKQAFSSKAIALSFFILNKWGDKDKEAYKFAETLYKIVLSDKNKIVNAHMVECKKHEIDQERKVVESFFNTECIEMCFDRIYGMYHINFDMLFAELGLKDRTLSDSINIKKIIRDESIDIDCIVDILSYNNAILLTALEQYIVFLNENKIHYNLYARKINEKRIEELEKELQQKEQYVLELIKGKEELIEKNNDVIQTYENKIGRLEKEIEKQKRLLRETAALRSYVYELQVDVSDIAETHIYKWDELDSEKVVVVGGTDSWQKRLKEKLPSWKFISASQNNIDRNIIVGSKYVFFNTSFVGHSLYYSIVSMIQSSEGTKLCFINNNNIDRVHDEILKQIR